MSRDIIVVTVCLSVAIICLSIIVIINRNKINKLEVEHKLLTEKI